MLDVRYFLGALFVVIIQIIYQLVLNLVKNNSDPQEPGDRRDGDGNQPLSHPPNKKGIVWVLESEKVPKVSFNASSTKRIKEQKNEEIFEVCPVRKYAKIEDRSLILSDDDGSEASIKLSGCTIVSVSASNLYPRQWSKRYPIKLENKSSVIYQGSKLCYLYLNTSRKKESWCKALRLASCADKANEYARLSDEFRNYLTSVNAEYLSYDKPRALSGEITYAANNVKKSSSKVRRFLKRLSKKAPKNGVERKTNSVSSSGSLMDMVQHPLPPTPLSGNKDLPHVLPDTIQDNKYLSDEGTLCWSMLLWRLFFDIKKSPEIINIIKAHIQRTLLDMKNCHYIDEVTCTRLDLGNTPPCIHNIRVLSLDMNEAWEIEVDIEYSGGLVLDIETRAGFCDPEMEESINNTSLEPSFDGELISDLVEGCENYEKELNLPDDSADGRETKDEENKLDRSNQLKGASWGSTCMTKLKAIKGSAAEPVSQVDTILAVKVASLRGTLQLHIMSPPSDQLWFGFKSMPEIDLKLESVDGERKITSHIALAIINQFKDAIRENLVHPNCESICIPWMLGEKDAWVQRKVAPFLWVDKKFHTNSVSGSENSKSSTPLDNSVEIITDVLPDTPSQTDPLEFVSSNQSAERNTTSELDESSSKMDIIEDLWKRMEESPEISPGAIVPLEEHSEENLNQTGAIVPLEKYTRENLKQSEEDLKPKKFSRKSRRMMDIGKKMGEKFEEKRRHIEEKSRHIVEKIRETKKNDN